MADLPGTHPPADLEAAGRNHGQGWDEVYGLHKAVPSVMPAAKTTTYTAAAGEFVRCDATTAAFTVTLPAAPGAGATVTVTKVDASVNAITVVGSGATTINGQASAAFTERYAGATFIFDGSNWLIRSVM